MSRPGPLYIIGGHEEKEGDRTILSAFASELAGGKLVLATIASHDPEGYLESYRNGLAELHTGEIVELYVDDHADPDAEAKVELLDGAAGIFFSGGDQERILTQIGGSRLEQTVRSLWENGAVVAGTSAGASALGDTMLVKGHGEESYRRGDLRLADGLGFVKGVIIDQHFAERGRTGRLLGALVRRPDCLGIGIDEDTAIKVVGDQFTVIGSGAVYVFDGAEATRPPAAEGDAASFFDVTMHVLTAGDGLDLSTRRPT